MKNIRLIYFFIFQILLPFWTFQQVIFSEDFQTYNVASNQAIYIVFNGTWYRADVAKETGVYKIKGSTSKISSKFMGVFSQSASSLTCIDLTLNIGSIYQISFDHTWQYFQDFTLKASWNSIQILNYPAINYGLQGIFVHFSQQLPMISLNINTLCFFGSNPTNPGSRVGPSIDNVLLTLISSANNSQPSNNSSPSNTSNNTNGSNTSSTNSSTSSNSTNSSNSSNTTINPNESNSTTGNNTNQTNNTNSSGNISTNQTQINQQMEQNQNQLNHINMQWVKQFSSEFNKFIKFTSFFGFAYLISNILNFWNIIVLYYFVSLDSILKVYRSWLEELCRISLQQGSILTLLSQINIRIKQPIIPNQQYQKIPLSENQWQSFFQMGFSSQILNNNFQLFLILILCVIKLLLVNFVKYIFQKFQHCLYSFFLNVKLENKKILCYQIIANMPTILIPFGVMLSRFSATASINYKQKINNAMQVFTLLIYLFLLLIPVFFELRTFKLAKPQRPVGKTSIFIESYHDLSVNNQKPRHFSRKNNTKNTIFSEKKSKKKVQIRNTIQVLNDQLRMQTKMHQNIAYLDKLSKYEKQFRFHQYQNWKVFAQFYDNTLFFSIPFLIGLQCKQVFLIVNLIVVVLDFVLFVRSNRLIRQFNCVEYCFGACMKIVFIIIHVLYIVLFLHQIRYIRLQLVIRGYLSFLCIAIVVLGALIQTLHTIISFIIWIKQFIHNINQNKTQSKKDQVATDSDQIKQQVKQQVIEQVLNRNKNINKKIKQIHIKKERTFKADKLGVGYARQYTSKQVCCDNEKVAVQYKNRKQKTKTNQGKSNINSIYPQTNQNQWKISGFIYSIDYS